MTRDPGIICFKHCGPATTFCREVPRLCPLCDSVISDYVLEPFGVPYPCSDASQSPCTVAVRPSRGNFLEIYTPSEDLHIGLVDSQGRVFEFDRCGLVVDDSSAWRDCLALEAITESWRSHWDFTLSESCKNPKWRARNYDENFTNCFTFVIEFFENLKHPGLKFSSKEEFCELFVLPKIQETLRYAQIYRNLRNKDYFIV